MRRERERASARPHEQKDIIESERENHRKRVRYNLAKNNNGANTLTYNNTTTRQNSKHLFPSRPAGKKGQVKNGFQSHKSTKNFESESTRALLDPPVGVHNYRANSDSGGAKCKRVSRVPAKKKNKT